MQLNFLTYSFFSRMSFKEVTCFVVKMIFMVQATYAYCSECDAFISKYVKWQMSTMETTHSGHKDTRCIRYFCLCHLVKNLDVLTGFSLLILSYTCTLKI